MLARMFSSLQESSSTDVRMALQVVSESSVCIRCRHGVDANPTFHWIFDLDQSGNSHYHV